MGLANGSHLHPMYDDVEALVWFRRLEIARKQIVLCLSHMERVLSTCISVIESPLADRVWSVEKMQLVRDICLSE
jgi:hypothetical protein